GSSADADFVDVAPLPRFARLERLDHGMLRPVIVLRGVLVLRGVAAADVAAVKAAPQMHPRVARLQTFLASLAAGGRVLARPQVIAHLRHVHLLRSSACRSQRPFSAAASY